MSESGEFSEHISMAVSKARQKMGWILRTFRTREREPMMTLYKALVRPLTEYCCQLWNPYKIGEIQALESVQRSFTARISDLKNVNYWNRLSALKIYSLQRRRERYIIIYIWKIISGRVPDLEANSRIITRYHPRRGLLCCIRKLPRTAAVSVRTRMDNSFSVQGARLFNCLPVHVRETVDKLSTFKSRLDEFLKMVPDEPRLPHYWSGAASNSIVDQTRCVK